MKLRILFLAAVALLGLARRAAAAETPPGEAATFEKHVAPFLGKYCYACHNDTKKRGDVVLDQFKDEASLQKNRKVWDRVLHMLRSGEMPRRRTWMWLGPGCFRRRRSSN